MEEDLRIAAPAHAMGAVELVAIDDVAPDETFRLRPDGDVSLLATSLGRLGQLAPLELRPWPGALGDGPRWQVVAGFRRLAALRLLARERVLARLHGALVDEDAWALALADALLREPLGADDLSALRERLRASGVAPWADELVEEALVRAPIAPDLRERFLEFLAPARRGAVEEPRPAPPDGAGEGGSPAAASGDPPPLPGREEDAAGDASPEVVEVTPDDFVRDLAVRLSALNQDLAVALDAWEDLPADGRRAIVEQARYITELMPFLERDA